MVPTPPTPFQYQGSKRKLAPAILPFVPSGSRVIEAFAGSAAISIACAERDKSTTFLLNDLNVPLMGIWRAILDDLNALCDRYEDLWLSQGTDPIGRFHEVRDEFNKTGEPALLLFLLARIVKGAVRYNSQGEMNQSPDKRRLGTRPQTVRTQLNQIHGLMRGRTEVMSDDFRVVLDLASPSDVVYLDPPYQGVSGARDGRYLAGLPYDEFCAALEPHIERGIKMVISYDGSTGEKKYGHPLPAEFGLLHIHLDAGTSASSTLQGAPQKTIESLYVSKGLAEHLPPEQLLLVS